MHKHLQRISLKLVKSIIPSLSLIINLFGRIGNLRLEDHPLVVWIWENTLWHNPLIVGSIIEVLVVIVFSWDNQEVE